ncbi:MAG: sensor histidine kinase, partial [Flavobacteriales bacterium]|nr:sensor histidine kinase [Flavobacteriales bacterium]
QVKYETAEKEKQLAEQEVIITKEQLRVRQRNYTLVGLALVIIFIIILGVYIYKQQKFKQQKLIEENQLKDEIAKITLQNELHEERIRISRDLHDNVGSQLTFIISSVDNMGYLFKTADEKLREKLHGIADFSRTTITQLRDTIWALNKDEISFEDLKSRLYNYIESAKLAKENITFNFEVDVNQKISFNAIEGVNIYRIVQEAINNSLKYSAATTINVLLKESKDKLILKIEDDGIGFNINEVKLGNGLDNMKNRATSIKARFNIDSTPEKGTTILLEMPIK